MSRYLEAFQNTLSKIQARHLLELLDKYRQEGEIRSIEDYNKKLQELTSSLKSSRPVPTLKIFEAIVGELIDSDKYNAMIDSTTADLEALFGELDALLDRLSYQEEMIKNALVKSIDKAITQLEQKTNIYEFFIVNGGRYSDVQYENFERAEDATLNNALLKLLWDPRVKEFFTFEDLCEIDVFSKKLIMATETVRAIKPISVELVADSTTPSELSVDPPGSKLSNIIDGTRNTFWLHDVLLSDPNTTARIKLKFNFEGSSPINVFKIETACDKPMTIETIEWLEKDNTPGSYSLNADIGSQYTIFGPRAYFKNISFTFAQKHNEQVIYQLGNINSKTEVLLSNEGTKQALDIVTQVVQEELDSRIIEQIGAFNTETISVPVKQYRYPFGFDNLFFYEQRFKSKGIWIGDVLETEQIGVVSLRVTQNNPYLDGYNVPAYTLEFYIYKEDYDDNGSIIRTRTLPIMPLETTSIKYELLPLTIKDNDIKANAGITRFSPSGSSSPTVYKNLSDTLSIGADYVVAAVGDKNGNSYNWKTSWNDVFQFFDNNPTIAPQTAVVKILNPEAHAFYHISYDLRFTNSVSGTPVPVDSGVYWIPEGALRFEYDPRVNKSNVRLILVARNNFIDINNTFEIDEYYLAVECFDENKFEG